MRIAWTPRVWIRWLTIHASLERVTPQSALDDEEVEADAGEDDEEHHGRHRRAHGRIAELELISKEGAVEKSAENVGGEIRPGERSLDRVDEVEGVEVAYKGQHGNESDRRQHQRQLDVPEDPEVAEPVDSRRIDELVGNVEERGVDQHQRNADKLPYRDQGQGHQRC